MILVLILTFKADMITAIAKRRPRNVQVWTRFKPWPPAIPIQWSTSWATSPAGEWLLCEFMITRWRLKIYMWKSYIDSEAFSTVLYQLSYQVNWKRIIVWVHGNSVVEDGGRCTIYFKVIQLNCGVRNKFNFIIAVLNAIWSKGKGHLKISVLDRIWTLTSTKPIESVDCSTSWAIRYYY